MVLDGIWRNIEIRRNLLVFSSLRKLPDNIKFPTGKLIAVAVPDANHRCVIGINKFAVHHPVADLHQSGTAIFLIPKTIAATGFCLLNKGMLRYGGIYIEKPFSVEYLKVCVANLLNNREKLRASFVNSPFVQTGSMAMTKADESFLKTLKEVVVANMQNPDFCLDDMASLLNMSRSSLNRKIKGILDMTPNDYIRLERLKKAAQLLKEGECKINEVCYMTGFNTPSYFTKCFQKQFGILPKDFVK